MRRAGMITAPVGCGGSDHLCWEHDGADAWRTAAAAYLQEGAGRHERVVYASAGPRSALIEALADLPDRDELLASGQLRLLTVPPTDAPEDDASRAGGVLAECGDIAVAARDDGYRGMRVAVDASGLASTEDEWRRFTVRHLLGDAMVAAVGWSALCGYDRTRVPAAALGPLRFVHPLRRDEADAPEPDCALYAGGDGRWRLRGDVDVMSRDALSVALDALSGSGDVLLDMADVGMLDVGALRQLVALARRLDPGCRLVIHEPPDSVERVLHMGWGEVPGLMVTRS